MALLLVTATRLEMDAVLAGLGQKELPAPPEGGLASASLPDGHEARLLVTGIGPVNAAFVLGLALAGRLVDGIINLGVAGSFSLSRLPLGSVCVAATERWPEFGLHTANGLDAEGLGFAQLTTRRQKTFDQLELDPLEMAEELKLPLAPHWPQAASLTVAGVSGCVQRADMLVDTPETSPLPVIENMEGFALALGARRLGIPFLEVRTISNQVGSRPPVGWDLPLALKSLGKAAAHLLQPAA